MRKLRGWKRQVRRLEQRKNQLLVKGMNRKFIEANGYFDLQVMDICPGLGPIPPTWFNKLVTQALLEIYTAWHKQASEWMGEPFYLKVWLFDPDFYRSRIVFGLNENGYNQLFDKRTKHKIFPYQVFGSSNLLQQFDWQLFIDFHDYEQRDFYELWTKKQVDKIQQTSYRVLTYEFDSGTERVYRIDNGDVWIGSLR